MNTVRYGINEAQLDELRRHLLACDARFVPPLSGRVDVGAYAGKLVALATRVEAWHSHRLVGLIAIYCNDLESREAYISSVSVLGAFQGQGVASELMARSFESARAHGMCVVHLHVSRDNKAAISLYQKHGLRIVGTHDLASLQMSLSLVRD